MATGEAVTGIAAVGSVPWGAHFCQLYDTPNDMADVLVPYFRAGLENNELCHWVTSDQFGPEDAKSALRAVYPDLEKALASGQITIMDRRDWYQRGGRFKAEEVVGGWLAHEEEARSAGYSGYRLTGDTLWLEQHQWQEFNEYEKLVSEAFGTRRIIALCTYCMARCGASEVLDIVNVHSFAVARRRGEWQVIESPATKIAKAELAELNATLSRKVEMATSELRGLVSHKDALLREVHHRVKNNLQIVAHLLSMRSRDASEEARRALAETVHRVHAISAVHEALYENTEAAGVPLLDRLQVISRRMVESYEAQDRVSVAVSGDELHLPLSTSIPAALIATELISNALKHAFPEGRSGRVDIAVSTLSDATFQLEVSDDGIGWKTGESRRASGLTIARALVKQIDGRLDIEARDSGGTRGILTAPVQ
ncbi:MEDS domain-containing protein [Chelativorans sp.]|uniref:MEDS domain-containing protein n=1 Tax=Chelativorans sp. TaxID=2203393 RepID=UPI002811BBF1|nr:MEDS domain-containing protein [Chelativorans sp.]